MLDVSDAILRLGLAALIGGTIGLNRDLHGKPTGIRTLGLVALGSACVTFVAIDATAQLGAQIADQSAALSRIMQGVLTGIGFLGVGVIIHEDAGHRVTGLTTAACVWLTACIGMVCGIGSWKILVVALPLLAILLIAGGPIEKALHRRWVKTNDPGPREVITAPDGGRGAT
jgi:putative Mg2+ transporter-C (MgtC) family protein